MKNRNNLVRDEAEKYWSIIQKMNQEDRVRVMCRMFGFLVSTIEIQPEEKQQYILNCFHSSVMPVALNKS